MINDIFINDIIKPVSNKGKSSIRNATFITEEKLPEIFLVKDIINIINSKNNISEEIKDIIYINSNKYDAYIEEVKKILIRNTNKNKKIKIVFKEDENKTFLGRKRNEDIILKIHNKFSPDNIINKIKNILKQKLLYFVNNVINNIYDIKKRKIILNNLNIPNNHESLLIKDIEYKTLADKKSKNVNLSLLKLSNKPFLSQKISARYRSFNCNDESLYQSNKLLINSLLNDNENRNLFNFLFNNLTIDNFLDIFIYKKEISDFYGFNQLNEREQKILQKSLIRVETVFQEIKDEANYLLCFILLIYNYKRYFIIKQSRNRKKSIKNN
jgi:hypothetical protein